MSALTSPAPERLSLHGMGALSDAELLALLGPRPAARAMLRLLESAGGLRPLARWSTGEMARVRGVGPRRAAAISAALEVGRRAGEARLARGTPLCASRDVYQHFQPLLRDERRELFLAALLDVKNRLLREVRISEGSLCASLVHPREAFSAAVREPAHSLIFVHNHPSGDPTPSEEDTALTRRLVSAGDVLGIRVLDHVVVGDGEWFSFADAGRLG